MKWVGGVKSPHLFTKESMIIKINNKWEALHAVINRWLKDPRVYCNDCGATYYKEMGIKCCDNPHIGTNFDFCRLLIKQNKQMQATRRNEFASTGSKNMRWGVSMPPDLLRCLDNYMKIHGHTKGLFGEVKDLNGFMKKFPQFAIPKKV